MILLCLLALVGCKGKEYKTGSGVHYYVPGTEASELEYSTEESELFLVVRHDSATESMRLYRYSNGLEYQYYYTTDTEFVDSYGNHANAAEFSVGKAVHVDKASEFGKIKTISLASEVWEYEDVVRYQVDLENEILKIADTKYHLKESTFAFTGGALMDLSEISKEDELFVVGKDKDILSITVTSGDGTLKLLNTELFEGSFLQLGKKFYTEISKDMEIKVPEGSYTLVVANDGWGGSTTVTINRGETTEIDLDTIKGDGPKYGTVIFSVTNEGAVLKVDGVEVDTTQPQTLKYGRHVVTVDVDGFDTWRRYLYVNSPEGTIVITVEEENVSATIPSTNKSSESSSQESSSSETKSSETSSSSENKKNDDDYWTDYMSTLSNLLSSIN